MSPEMALLATLGLLLLLEIGLQIRMYLLTGQMAFGVASPSLVIRDKATGLRLLRRNFRVEGRKMVVETNSLGLRGPDIPRMREAGEWRIAMVGASSIFGATTARNEETVPQRLERELRHRMPDRPVTVINGGIPGYSIEEVTRQLEHVIAPLGPQMVLFYPGFQQISGSCRQRGDSGAIGMRLPYVTLPKWSLTYDLIYKNAAFLREKPRLKPAARSPVFDVAAYRESLERLHEAAHSAGAELVLMTAARGWREDLPLEDNLVLSRNIRHFANCLDTASLIAATDLYNQTLRDHADEKGLMLIDLAREVPGGFAHFDDGNHFSAKGEALVARLIADRLESRGAPAP